MRFLLIIFLFSAFARADDMEIIVGAPTYHLFDFGGNQFLHPKWTPDGRLIGTPIFGVGAIRDYEEYYTSLKLFAGNNCVAQPIGGVLVSAGVHINSMYYGVVGGGYIQNDRTFIDAGVEPSSFIEFGDYGLVPVIGGEINYRKNLSSRTYLKLNTLITPLLINESLSLGLTL